MSNEFQGTIRQYSVCFNVSNAPQGKCEWTFQSDQPFFSMSKGDLVNTIGWVQHEDIGVLEVLSVEHIISNVGGGGFVCNLSVNCFSQRYPR